MLTTLHGPGNTAALDAAIEALAKVIHEGDWSVGGSNNGGDWRWDRADKKARTRARLKARAVLGSDALVEILVPEVREAKCEAWKECLEAFGRSLLAPLREDGTRAPLVNPYADADLGPSTRARG